MNKKILKIFFLLIFLFNIIYFFDIIKQGGTMTKKDNIIIDEDTFTKITNENKDAYLKFLKENPLFVDVNDALENKKTKEESKIKNNLEEEKKLKLEKERELQERHKKDEDYRYVPSLVWLEMYLPRYELVYGEFKYSNDNLSNKQKCEELLTYFSDVCGITDIKDIYKKKPHRGFYR